MMFQDNSVVVSKRRALCRKMGRQITSRRPQLHCCKSKKKSPIYCPIITEIL